MSIELTLAIPELESEKRDDIIEALQSAMRRLAYRTGSMGHREGQLFRSATNLLASIDGRNVSVDWCVDLKPGNKADSIRLVCKDDSVSARSLRLFGERVISEARARVQCNGKSLFTVCRPYSYFGGPLDGSYDLPGGSLFPVTTKSPDDPPDHIPTEHALAVEVKVEAFSQEHAWQIAGDNLSVFIPRLSFILQRSFRTPKRTRRVASDAGECRHVEIGFDRSIVERPAHASRPGQWKGDLVFAWAPRRVLSCPPETIALLTSIERADNQVQKAFDGCARLLEASYAIPDHLASARLTLKVAAVEALAHFDDPRGTFKMFAARFMAELKPADRDRLYGSVRSGFIHSGSRHLRERMRATELFDGDGHERLDFAFRSHELLRRGIVRWMADVLGVHWTPNLPLTE